MAKKFIKEAVGENKGKLRAWAERHGFMLENGDIDLYRAGRYARDYDLSKRLKEIGLAKTLKRLRPKKRRTRKDPPRRYVPMLFRKHHVG